MQENIDREDTNLEKNCIAEWGKKLTERWYNGMGAKLAQNGA